MNTLTYTSPTGNEFSIPVLDKDGWVSQNDIITLSGRNKRTISEHIHNTIKEQGLQMSSVVRKFRTKLSDGKYKDINHYPSKVVVLVLFRVNSPNAIHFQSWAADHILNIMKDGVSIERPILKQPGRGLAAYNKINPYRLEVSEVLTQLKRVIRKNSADYEIHKSKYSVIVGEIINNVYYAVTGMSAVEIIDVRTNPNSLSFGLTTHRNKNIRKDDIVIAANYLSSDEQQFVRDIFEVVVGMSKVFARSRLTLSLVDWDKSITQFLIDARQQIIPNSYRYASRTTIERKIKAKHTQWKKNHHGKQLEIKL